MILRKFEIMFQNNNGIPLTDEWILWKKPLQLWNISTDEQVNFNSLNEVYDYKLGNETIKQLIERTDNFTLHYNGGRGASSGAMGGGFASGGSGNGKDNSFARLPVEFNGITGANNSYDATLKLFQQKYQNADHEYGITVDELGYVHTHIEGNAGSVAISGNKGQMVIHNHPSNGWGNFSDADLLSTAMEKSRGIVATGPRATVTFTKTSHFDPTEFAKAVKKAQWPTKYNYDQGADWWLKKNQKTYGYKYTGEFYNYKG